MQIAAAIRIASVAMALASRSEWTVRALALTIVWPIVTCPSPASATWPRWRTATTVVAWNAATGSAGMRPVSLGSLYAGARVGGVVDAHELVRAHVGVALRRRQPAVAQELLDRPQVRARVEQVGRERVAQRVRADPPRDPARRRAPLHDRMD